MGCTQAEIALLLEALWDRILEECGDELSFHCKQLLNRIINDLREYGKDYVRSRYGL